MEEKGRGKLERVVRRKKGRKGGEGRERGRKRERRKRGEGRECEERRQRGE